MIEYCSTTRNACRPGWYTSEIMMSRSFGIQDVQPRRMASTDEPLITAPVAWRQQANLTANMK
jgi:hypothetical protein